MALAHAPTLFYKKTACMKKLIPLVAFALLLLLAAFSIESKKAPSAGRPPANAIVACLPPPVQPQPISDADFKARYGLPLPMVRKSVYALSAAEITSIKNGITAMKGLNYTDPTSWEYQAAIHGTTRPDNLPSWNTCHKPGFSFFFLAWHRMYVYFFERILRAKAGNPNLTLPYWNYQTNPVLHPDYRNSAAGNPLYDATRSASINGGGALPNSIMTSFENSLNNNTSYYPFQTAINSPHGSVHTTIGGNMFSTSSAAKDPVFWLHHCNIDRLWERWLRKCGGRGNPTDAQWLNQSYTFFDENGTAVSMTGSQVVKTASQLNYKYDSLTTNPICLKPIDWAVVQKWQLFKLAKPLQLAGTTQKLTLATENTEALDKFMVSAKRQRFDFVEDDTPERLMLTLGGIRIEKMPEGVVEVYLNLPPNVRPSANSKYYVGLLNLFDAEHHGKHVMAMPGMADETGTELDVTAAVKAQGLALADLKKAQVSLVVRGNTLRGQEVKTDGRITVSDIQFNLQSIKKQTK
jgi:hypothetical protein